MELAITNIYNKFIYFSRMGDILGA